MILVSSTNYDKRSLLAYLIGFIVGDGNLSKKGYLIRLYDQNESFVRTILLPAFQEVFSKTPRVYYDTHNNGFVLYTNSKSIWTQIKNFGVPIGSKAHRVEIPSLVQCAEKKSKLSFVAGLFDAEGSTGEIIDKKRHPKGYRYFQMKTVSPKLIEQTAQLLRSTIEVSPRTYHYNYGSILRINGLKNVVYCFTQIGVRYPRFSFLLP